MILWYLDSSRWRADVTTSLYEHRELAVQHNTGVFIGMLQQWMNGTLQQ